MKHTAEFSSSGKVFDLCIYETNARTFSIKRYLNKFRKLELPRSQLISYLREQKFIQGTRTGGGQTHPPPPL